MEPGKSIALRPIPALRRQRPIGTSTASVGPDNEVRLLFFEMGERPLVS
jgi:hypothetical protein